MTILKVHEFVKALSFIILSITCLICGVAMGQSVANYSVVRNTGITYSSIASSGSSFASWRYNGTYSEDDNRSNLTDIGFDFWYNGIRYTQFSVSTNGFLDFSSSKDDGGPQGDDFGYINSAFTQAAVGNATRPALAVFYDDMTTTGGIDPLGTCIKYQLSGSSPNQVLTVEWDGMAVYQNTTPDLNFQIKLYESTGIVEYIYETMDNGSKIFSYTIGINAETVSATPTASELLTQQTANGTAFNNTIQNNISTMPVANSQLTFTPVVPTADPSGLSFSSVTNTGMTLNWTDNATNEVGHVLYYSIDGINYYFQVQESAGVSSSVITGLSPATNYFWRVYAVTEGALSNALTGNQMTLAPGTIISAQNGRWANNATWVGGVQPSAGDNVLIRDNHMVTLRSNGSCNDLNIGEGASGQLRIGRNNSSAKFTLNMSGNLNIDNGGKINVRNTSNATHDLNIEGNIVNNGTLAFSTSPTALCRVSFNSTTSDQLISGTGNNGFHTINLSKGQIEKILEITSADFSCSPDGLLFLGGGTFKFSSPGSITSTVYDLNTSIPANAKVWMNSSNSDLTFASGIDLEGKLLVDAGTINIGNAADENLISYGGNIDINSGSVNIAGRYDRVNSDATSNFNMTGGAITLATIGSSSNTRAPFTIDVVGSTFNMSGGSIVLQNEGGSGAEDLGFINTGSTFGAAIGGYLQIGNAATSPGQTMQINSSFPIGGIKLNSANATGQLLINNLMVSGNVELNSGTFESNNLNIYIEGNWSNNGAIFVPGNSLTSFNGSNIQSISGTALAESFNDITVNTGSTVNIGPGFTVFVTNVLINEGILDNDGTVDVFNGYVGQTGTLSGNGTHRLSGGNWDNSTGNFIPESSTVEMAGSSAQTLQGATTYNNLTIENSSGVSITADNHNITNTLTLSAGLFSTNNAVTLLSDASGTGRIAEITGGSVSGNIVAQQYISGNDNWRLLSAPVDGSTLADWSNEFWMSGFTGSTYPSTSFTSVYTYDETIFGDLDQGYSGASDVGNSLTPTTGYIAWVGALPVGSGVTTTLDVTGTVNVGQKIVNVSYTDDPAFDDSNDGWMLIGNPYPSDIDWSKVDIAGGVGNFAYVYNPGTSTYIALDHNAPNIIAQHQAFWVKCTDLGGGGTVTFEESDKAAGGIFYKHSNLNSLILNVDGMAHHNATEIRLDDNATINYEYNLDAFSWPSTDAGAPNLMTLANNGFELDINTVKDTTVTVSIPVKLTVGLPGNYSISMEDSSAILDHSCLYLEDLHEGIITDLRLTPNYSFYISDTVTSARFMLHIGGKVTFNKQNITCFNGNDGQIELEGQGAGPWNYSIINTATSDTSVVENVFTQIIYPELSAGDYEVSIANTDESCATSVNFISIEQPSELLVLETIVDVACWGDATGTIDLSIEGGTSPYNYLWSNGSTSLLQTGISGGVYVLSVVDNQGCESEKLITISESSAVIVNTQIIDLTCYSASDGELLVDVSGGVIPYTYQWYNGDSIANLTDLSAGIYQLSVMDANDCFKFAAMTISEPQQVVAQFMMVEDTIGVGELISFINSSQGANAYLWDFGDGNTDNQATAQYTYQVPGTYNVILLAENNGLCADYYSKTIVVEDEISGVTEYSQQSSLSMHVAGDNLIVSINALLNQEVNILIYNSIGQIVLSQKVIGPYTKVPIVELPRGVYIVDVQNRTGTIFEPQKIVW